MVENHPSAPELLSCPVPSSSSILNPGKVYSSFLDKRVTRHELFGKGITPSVRLSAGGLTQSSGAVNKAGRRCHAGAQRQPQHNRAHGGLTGKEKPVKLRQVLICSKFIPAETLSSSWRQNSTRHRSVVWIFFMGFLNNPLSREAFYIPAHVLQQPVPLAADQASLQSTSAQLKLFSKNLRNKGASALIQGTRTSNWFRFVTGPSIYPLPKAMKTAPPQRLKNSLLIGVVCALARILGPEFSLVPTRSEHRLV